MSDASIAPAGIPRFRLALVLTHACPLRCTYCFAGRARAFEMPDAVASRAIDRALASLGPAGGRLDLVLMGGEPLAALGLARRAVARAREAAAARGARVRTHLTTSGAVPLRGDALAFVRDEVDELALGIDGTPDVHDLNRGDARGRGSSSSALAALDAVVALGRPFQVISVVRPETVDHLADGVRFLAARGARAFAPSIDWAAPWDAASARRLEDAVAALGSLWAARFPELAISWLETPLATACAAVTPAEMTCGFGDGEVAVAPSGRLYPCERLVGEDRDAARAIGRIDDEDGPFATAAGSGPRRAPASGSPCSDCALAPTCARTCACANLARTGRKDEPDGVICAFEEARLRAAARALETMRSRRDAAA